MERERRRSPRVWTTLWLALDGIDAEMRPYTGNLSATGIYFHARRAVGEPGTVEWVVLSSADRVVSLEIMACVVRCVRIAGRDEWGIGLEFMPESDEAVAQLRDFLHYVLALAADGVRATEARPSAARAGVHSVVLETDWSLSVGAPVRVEVIARGVDRTTRIEGRAVRVTPDAQGRHRIEVAVQRDMDGPLRRFSTQSMPAVRVKERVEGPARRFTPAHGIPFAKDASADDGFARADDDYVTQALEGLIGTLLDLRTQPKPEPRSHLAGEVARIRLPTLLSVIDMEKMTGELSIERGGVARRVFFRGGQIVDVEPSGASVREEVRALLAWDDGHFEFTVKPVERDDRLRMTTVGLLIDLAREDDEARRDAAGP